MSLRNKISQYVSENGVTSINDVFMFIFEELGKSLNVIKVLSSVFVMVNILAGYILNVNGVMLIDEFGRSFIAYLIIVSILGLSLLLRLMVLIQYKSIVDSFYSDYTTALRSRVDDSVKQYKVSYILSVLIKTLSTKTKTSKITVLNVLVGHRSNELKTILR